MTLSKKRKIAIIFATLSAIGPIISLVWASHMSSAVNPPPADTKVAVAAVVQPVPTMPTNTFRQPDRDTDNEADPPAPKPKANTKKERGINARLQAIEAQLRYWGNEEKQKVKDYEDAPQMSRIIGQNVQKLWLEKLELQETSRNLNINLAMPLPKKKRPGINKEEE
jgi:hypothetical protein